MKKAIYFLLATFIFPNVFAKTYASALEPSLEASVVVTSVIPGQLNMTLTLSNTGDEVLTNLLWFASDSITFTSSNLSFLGIGETVTIQGTRPFSACIYSGNMFIMSSTLDNTQLPPLLVEFGYTVPTSAAPHVTSVVVSDCNQVPVNGNMEITLSGLPSGNWTLHGDNESNFVFVGSGPTVVLNLNATVVGNGIRFYFDAPSGCPSAKSQFVTRNENYNFDMNAPMTGSYVDANSDGITNAGDQIIYQIQVKNTRACLLNTVGINGIAPSYTNPNLSFSGNSNIDVDVPGYSTVSVPATYIITTQDISNGYVTNSTSVNPHWPGSSSVYYPSSTVNLNVLGTTEISFQNFASYPNPVQNIWQITNGFPIEKVEIMTILGQSVRTITMHDLTTTIDMSDLSSGSYIARIHAGRQVKVVRIIKS